MREFEQKRKTKRILSSPFVLVPLAIIFLFLVRGTWGIYLKDRAATTALYSSEQRLAQLQSQQASLMAQTERLSTESGIESEIRDRYHMAKSGEREIVIVDSPPKEPAEAASTSRGLLQKIIDFFTIR